jgi:hypothetical protein
MSVSCLGAQAFTLDNPVYSYALEKLPLVTYERIIVSTNLFEPYQGFEIQSLQYDPVIFNKTGDG